MTCPTSWRRCSRSEAFLAFDAPAPLCAHYWSGEIVAGLRDLAGLGSDRLLTVRYEDFLARPAALARELIGFICEGDVDEAWVARAAALVGQGRSRWQALPERARIEVERACAPGFAALAGIVAP